MKHARKSFTPLAAQNRLLPVVAAIAALFAGVANAQQAAKPAAKADDSNQLEAITVTATKRSESLQSVPVAVTETTTALWGGA